MDQQINSNDIISNDTSFQPTQTVAKRRIYCKECNSPRKRIASNENPQICHVCYKAKKLVQSGNKIIDDFIRHTHIHRIKPKVNKMTFVPYDKFKNIKFIAEGGFSKIYKAIWKNNRHVVLKKLNNSKNITSKELNELRVSYDFSTRSILSEYYISKYYGITQDPNTQEMMIIMPYYDSGDLIHYMTKNFYNISWEKKLLNLEKIIFGLSCLHSAKIVHRDLHSGNIFIDNIFNARIAKIAKIGDLGLSKSATTESIDDNENYGIIPYMAPEIFQGQKYTEASDMYSFGMIMWEFMTGRRPFWDRNHDTSLIIEIVDGLRPPIVTNAPEGYIELMKECWHPDPEKRPTARSFIYWKDDKFNILLEKERKNPTKIIESPDIGPAPYNPGAIYKSRPLSAMIQSARSSRSSTQSTDSYHYHLKSDPNFTGKRKFVVNFDNHDNGKRTKHFSNENNDYLTQEIGFDINVNFSQSNQL